MATILDKLIAFDRDAATAQKHFPIETPADFNFGFDVIDAWAQRDDRTAIVAVSRDGSTIRKLRYSELSDRSSRFANALLSLGLKQGDFACVVIGRVPAWHETLIGCAKTGIVAMPGTNLLTAKDLSYRIQKSQARAVIVASEHCDKVDAIRGECPSLKVFIVVGDKRPGWLAFEELCAGASPDLAQNVRASLKASDMMMVYFTSGTTSMPKMVPRDHAYALSHILTARYWMDLQPSDLHWTVSDTGWAKAAWGLLCPQLLVGTPMVLHDGAAAFDADLHLRLLEKLKVTTFCAPPTAYRLFAKMDLSPYDFSSLRHSISAGEPLNPEALRVWKAATGSTVKDGYGQTETINIVANVPGMEVRPGSMGKPVPGLDVDVIDDDGNRLPNDEVGHIGIRITEPWPPGLFEGYYTGGELDRGSFRNGWYYTGDTCRRDADGYLWFVGRADDLINSAGYRISPFEVESTLIEHPAVAESAVIAVPDEARGEIVKACIVLTKGYSPSPELVLEIQNFCKEHTAPYKYPRQIEFMSELPKTISGKIRRVQLRETAAKS